MNYHFIQDCKNRVGLRVFAYDSLDEQGNFIQWDDYGSAKADEWVWIDPATGQPIGLGNTTAVGYSDIGYQGVILVPMHNGCQGINIFRDSVCYVCPPVAAIEYPTNDDRGTPPVFCEYPSIDFVNGSKGGMMYEWYMGDSDKGLSDQTKIGPLYTLYTKITGQDSIIDPDPSFDYTPPDSLRGNPNFYLYKNGGVVVVTLKAFNWDSTSNEYLPDGSPHPTYNRCKYCEDEATQVIFISDAIMNFVADKYDVCQGDSVQIFDSTFCSVGITRWGFELLRAADPSNADYPVGQYIPMNPTPKPTEPYMIHLNKPNIYTFMLFDTCMFQCVRNDSLTINVWPRSIPAFTASKTPSIANSFNMMRDTLCFNKPDTLYLKDASYTAVPFDKDITIVNWDWRIPLMEQYVYLSDSTPIAIPNSNGMPLVELTITNDKGCDSTFRFVDRILINSVGADFATPGYRKVYCNNTEIGFVNRSRAFPTAQHEKHTTIICEWDFGDGSPILRQTHLSPSATEINLNSPAPYLVVRKRYNFPDPETKVIVTLRVKMEGSDCEDVFIDTFTIIRPVANFTDDGHRFPCAGDNGRTINFSDSSLGGVTFYTWHFGEGALPSVGPNMTNPVYTYKTGGSYDVMLVVMDSTGCTDTMHKPKHVFIDGAIGYLVYSPLSGCIPMQLTVQAKGPGPNERPIADTSIHIPDGASAYRLAGVQVGNPVRHSFNVLTAAGKYLPHLQLIKNVTFEGREEVCVINIRGEDTVYVIDLQPDFKTDSLYCFNALAEFERSTTVNPYLVPDSVFWDYGNGDSLWIYNTSIESIDGETTYENPGQYRVTLKEHHKLCSKEKSHIIEVMEEPELSFLPRDTFACDGLPVVFRVDPSTLDSLLLSRIVDYEWVFEDNGERLTGDTVEREFTETDVYYYKVLVTFTPKNCMKEWRDSVIIFAYKSPTAEFSTTPDPPIIETGGSIQFTDSSLKGDGDIVTWKWDFNDEAGGSSTLQNPSHTYSTTSGERSVLLEIWDTNGCYSYIRHTVTIMEKIGFPNIFTPTGSDGTKYVFKPLERKGYYKSLRLEIYNRWGMLVWSQKCNDPNCPEYDNNAFWWDGRNKQGNPVSDGVYFWVLYAQPLTEIGYAIQNGSVTVINKK